MVLVVVILAVYNMPSVVVVDHPSIEEVDPDEEKCDGKGEGEEEGVIGVYVTT